MKNNKLENKGLTQILTSLKAENERLVKENFGLKDYIDAMILDPESSRTKIIEDLRERVEFLEEDNEELKKKDDELFNTCLDEIADPCLKLLSQIQENFPPYSQIDNDISFLIKNISAIIQELKNEPNRHPVIS